MSLNGFFFLIIINDPLAVTTVSIKSDSKLLACVRFSKNLINNAICTPNSYREGALKPPSSAFNYCPEWGGSKFIVAKMCPVPDLGGGLRSKGTTGGITGEC